MEDHAHQDHQKATFLKSKDQCDVLILPQLPLHHCAKNQPSPDLLIIFVLHMYVVHTTVHDMFIRWNQN